MERELAPMPPLPRDTAIWHEAARIALAFWERVADETRVSGEFRAIATLNTERVKALT